MKQFTIVISLATLLVGCASVPQKYVLNPANANNSALVQLAINTKYHKWVFPLKPAEYLDIAIWDYSKIADGSACKKQKSLFGSYSLFDESKAFKGMLSLEKNRYISQEFKVEAGSPLMLYVQYQRPGQYSFIVDDYVVLKPQSNIKYVIEYKEYETENGNPQKGILYSKDEGGKLVEISDEHLTYLNEQDIDCNILQKPATN